MKPRRVLVIDDSPTVAARIKRALGSDYETRSAAGAWEALDKSCPDAVIRMTVAIALLSSHR